MEEIIENDHIKIKVKAAGAELTSITDQRSGNEMLWQADPEFWGRHAPVLFPIVGRLKENRYNYKGKTYEMSQHGFARDMDFKLMFKTKDYLEFWLKSDDHTLKKYPFPFELRLGYRLEDATLIHTYEIKNTGTEEMLFSIGAHPAYNLNGDIKEYHVEFNKPEENLQRTYLNGGLLAKKRSFPLQSDVKLGLSDALFADDAVVFESLNSDRVSLFKKNEKMLEIEFADFPFFGIWTKPNAPFLCLEPWLGIADEEEHNGDLTKKKGMIRLSPGLSKVYSYSVRFGD